VDLYKIFPTWHYVPLTVSKFVQVVQKWLGTNTFVHPKSHPGSKLSQISLGLLRTWWTVVVHLYCHFALQSLMVPQQTAKFPTASFRHFRSTFKGRIASPIMDRFGRPPRHMLQDWMYFRNALNVLYFRP